MSKAQKLFRVLIQQPPSNEPITFKHWLLTVASEALEIDQQAAERFVDSYARQTWNRFKQYNEELSKKNSIQAFSTLDDINMVFSTSAPYAQFGKKKLTKATHRWRAIEWIDLSLSSRDYEFLSALSLKLAGVEKVYVTPSGNEGGIDFCALVPLDGKSHCLHGKGRVSKIIGQCKKHSSPISVIQMREFCQVMTAVRNEDPKTTKHLPQWFIDSDGPLIGWVVGHRGFQSGCIQLAAPQGILLSDSINLAEGLVLPKTIPFAHSSNEIISALTLFLQSFKDHETA